MTLLLGRQDVQNLMTMQDAIQIVEEAFRQLALGNVIMPQPTVIRVAQNNRTYLGMPAYIDGELCLSQGAGSQVEVEFTF